MNSLEPETKTAEVELFRCGCPHCDQAERELRRLSDKHGARFQVTRADKQELPGVRPGWNTPLVFVNGWHVSHYRVSTKEWDKAIAEGVVAEPPIIKGEVLDLDCWLEHVPRGPTHIECADACLKRGSPLGLLAKGDEVYLLLPDRVDPAPYEALKLRVGDYVFISGRVHRHGGVQGVVVRSIEDEDGTSVGPPQ